MIVGILVSFWAGPCPLHLHDTIYAKAGAYESAPKFTENLFETMFGYFFWGG